MLLKHEQHLKIWISILYMQTLKFKTSKEYMYYCIRKDSYIFNVNIYTVFIVFISYNSENNFI